jgi:hypothetical protein
LFAEDIKKDMSIGKMGKFQASLKNLLLFLLSIEVEGMQVGFQNEINAENRKLLSSIISLTKTIFLCKNGGCAGQD